MDFFNFFSHSPWIVLYLSRSLPNPTTSKQAPQTRHEQRGTQGTQFKKSEMEASSSTLRSKVSSLFSSNIENRDLSTKKSPKSNSCASTPTKMMEKPEKGKKLYLDKSVAPRAQVRNQFQHEIFIIYKRCALTSKKLQLRSHNNMMKNPRTK